MDLNQISQRARRVNQRLIQDLLIDEILENGEQIITLVRDRWIKGKRPDGTIIGEYRDPFYREQKLLQNPIAGGNVDLILTGALSFDLTVFPTSGGDFNIFSKDEKALSIADKYGLDVYGLSPDEELRVMNEALSRVNFKLINFVQLGISL